MRDGFILALVQLKRCLSQRLPLAGRAGPGDMRRVGKLRFDLTDGADRGGDGAAVVVVIKMVEQASVLAHKRDLCGAGARIDAELAVALVGR